MPFFLVSSVGFHIMTSSCDMEVVCLPFPSNRSKILKLKIHHPDCRVSLIFPKSCIRLCFQNAPKCSAPPILPPWKDAVQKLKLAWSLGDFNGRTSEAFKLLSRKKNTHKKNKQRWWNCWSFISSSNKNMTYFLLPSILQEVVLEHNLRSAQQSLPDWGEGKSIFFHVAWNPRGGQFFSQEKSNASGSLGTLSDSCEGWEENGQAMGIQGNHLAIIANDGNKGRTVSCAILARKFVLDALELHHWRSKLAFRFVF